MCAATLTLPGYPASLTTLHTREHRQQRTLHRDLGTVQFFKNHPRQARSKVGLRVLRFARAELRWTRRELRETRLALKPRRPLFERGWLAEATCIHQHEGAWNANTGNGYFGGLQFLPSTYRSVGGRADGRADLDSPQEQLHRAYLVWLRDGRSFREWGTAGACGVG